MIGRTNASNLKKELTTGKTRNGRPLTAKMAQERLDKLRLRAGTLQRKYRLEEEERIAELEKKFREHISAEANRVVDEVTRHAEEQTGKLQSSIESLAGSLKVGALPKDASGELQAAYEEASREAARALAAKKVFVDLKKTELHLKKEERAAKKAEKAAASAARRPAKRQRTATAAASGEM